MWSLDNFDVNNFLQNYWQKKPLLIRQGLPGFSSLVSPEELAGLACEEEVHSRLVIENGAESPWQLSYGPFNEDVFTRLPQTHYSLLVSECEKWIPELQSLLDLFDFIPKWRIDDLMISYAPEHGSVGPHIDEYDVFLIQAQGQRQWSIQDGILENPEVIPNLDLAILQQFSSDQSWILEAGDILYLPPKVAHHGVAVGDGCMTYSVGFRAPAVSDVMDSFLLECSDQGLTDTRYSDLPLNQERHPAEIQSVDIEHFKSMVEQLLDQSASLWPDIIGKLLSDSNLSNDVEIVECDNLQQASSLLWQRHPDSKLFYHTDSKKIRLYFNGKVETLPATEPHLQFCQHLCCDDEFTVSDMGQLSEDAKDLFMHLIDQRALIPVFDYE